MIDNKANYSNAAIVSTYDTLRRINENDYVNSIEVSYFLKQAEIILGSAHNGRIIDFGAGTGKLALAFARQGYEVTALDQSELMLSQLREKAESEGLNIVCRIGDVVEGFTNDTNTQQYDIAVSSRVLMHVSDPKRMLENMTRMSRHGVIFDVPRIVSANSMLFLIRLITGGEAYRCFRESTVKAYCEQLNLRISDSSRMFVVPIGFHLKLNNHSTSKVLEHFLGIFKIFSSTYLVTAIPKR